MAVSPNISIALCAVDLDVVILLLLFPLPSLEISPPVAAKMESMKLTPLLWGRPARGRFRFRFRPDDIDDIDLEEVESLSPTARGDCRGVPAEEEPQRDSADSLNIGVDGIEFIVGLGVLILIFIRLRGNF